LTAALFPKLSLFLPIFVSIKSKDVLEKYKFLVVDKKPQHIQHLFEVSNPDHFRVFVASNGGQAAQHALNYPPDTINIDRDMMPENHCFVLSAKPNKPNEKR
jgi:PleD family two-component response regulator